MEKTTDVTDSEKMKKSGQSSWIGMICYFPTRSKNENHMFPWMVRAFAIERELQKYNYKLLCYEPDNIDYDKKTVSGYTIDYNRFRKVSMAIPKINYNFYIGSSNKKYLEFETWGIKQGYQIYPVKKVRKLAGDKLLTAQTLESYDKSIIPFTQAYTGTIAQLELFNQKNETIFIKPRFGNMGDGIFVIKNEKSKYIVTYYNQGTRKSGTFMSMSDCVPFIEKYFDDQDYIIQEGINVVQYDGSIFDIRAILFSINNSWEFLSEIRVGAKYSNLSNIAQGGKSFKSEEFLNKLYSKKQAQLILEKIKRKTMQVASHLNDRYENMINEISFDIVIDSDLNIYIVELNVKPGLAGSPKTYNSFFLMNDSERELYEKVSLKHGEYLAKSLVNK